MSTPGTAPCPYCGRKQPEMAAYVAGLQQRLGESQKSATETYAIYADACHRNSVLAQRITDHEKLLASAAEENAELTAQLAAARQELQALKDDASIPPDDQWFNADSEREADDAQLSGECR